MTLKIAYPPQPCSALWATLTLTLHLKGAEIETWTLARNWKFESISLQRRVASELGFCKAGPRAMLHELATAKARIAALEENSRELNFPTRSDHGPRYERSSHSRPSGRDCRGARPKTPDAKPVQPWQVVTSDSPAAAGNDIHPAAQAA